ncbi:MAG: hypothetical protein JRE58_10270 [Deltaproteobacteria bacterium]|nr:hypothetical protein [Deltaproteobacteria bacterium]
MHWSDAQEVIKARDIHLTDLGENPSIRYHIPINKIKHNTAENADNDREKKKKIKQEAEARLKVAKKDAYQKGFSKGVREGMEREKKGLFIATKAVVKLTRELKILNINFLKNNEKTMLDLSFAIAAKVIHKEVSTNREIICSVLEDAIRDMQDREGARISMNPEDYRCIIETNPAFIDQYSDILFEQDDKIGPGGAVIEMQTGTVDARLDQQLDKIKEALYDEHGH